MTDEQANLPKTEPFKFTGQAGEFFGIWFVNNILMLLTLGIYAPWAKVRTLQYFYGNTKLAGGSFQFTANPLTILRSRIIAVFLFILYIVADSVASTLATIVLITLLAAYFIFAPVLTVYVMSFKLRYSAWRGIAFKFNKDFKGAYRVYFAPLTLIMLFFASFYLPLNSEKVEELLGLDPYVATSEMETGAIEPDELNQESPEPEPAYQYKESESEVNDIVPGETETGATGSPDDLDLGNSESEAMDPQYEEASEDQINEYDADIAATETETGTIEPLDESNLENSASEPAYQYEEGEDELNEDTTAEGEDEYINPYLFIPAGILLLLNLLLWPYFDFISNRFLVRNTRFGAAKWRYTATAGLYYALYGMFALITLGFALAGAIIIMKDFDNSAKIILSILLALLFFSTVRAYMKSRRYNLLFNNIEIAGGYKLQAAIPFHRFFFLVVTNSLVVTLTFGMMAAWARIRTTALMLQYTALTATESMDKFVADQQQENSALAEEIGDVFDVELGL